MLPRFIHIVATLALAAISLGNSFGEGIYHLNDILANLDRFNGAVNGYKGPADLPSVNSAFDQVDNSIGKASATLNKYPKLSAEECASFRGAAFIVHDKAVPILANTAQKMKAMYIPLFKSMMQAKATKSRSEYVALLKKIQELCPGPNPDPLSKATEGIDAGFLEVIQNFR
ncbi:hypothetical protein FQN57_004550 [Myotisia sp. PD_48]|nr:hypothetical protein FQN57_004550 [Myotisia sp. PD_48]